jgi:hypothetical protein
VQAGTPARQRFRVRDAPRLVVGVPLPAAGAAYFTLAYPVSIPNGKRWRG